MSYNDALDDVMLFADFMGTDAHRRFFAPTAHSSDYWSGMADAYADTMDHCNQLRRDERGALAGIFRRLLRGARIRLGI